MLPELLLKTVSIAALVMTFKFMLLIALFIFVRGGIPRYRYDFLTKIG
jgi:NADH:ubiquinone oxidoreductase subunit H